MPERRGQESRLYCWLRGGLGAECPSAAAKQKRRDSRLLKTLFAVALVLPAAELSRFSLLLQIR